MPVTSAGCGRRNRTPADRLRLARSPGAPGRDGGECEQRRALVGRLAGACAHAVSAARARARGPRRCARNGARWNQSWAQGGPDAPGLCFERHTRSRIQDTRSWKFWVLLYTRTPAHRASWQMRDFPSLATRARMTSPGVPANARTETRAMRGLSDRAISRGCSALSGTLCSILDPLSARRPTVGDRQQSACP